MGVIIIARKKDSYASSNSVWLGDSLIPSLPKCIVPGTADNLSLVPESHDRSCITGEEAL